MRRWAPVAALAVAFAIVSVLVVPRVHVDGSPRLTHFEFDRGAAEPPGLRLGGGADRSQYGYAAAPFEDARVSFDLPAEAPAEGERRVLFITVGGTPGLSTQVFLVDDDGTRHELGRPDRWFRHRVDVTGLVERGGGKLRVEAWNGTPSVTLFADEVRVATYPSSAIPRAGRWEVAGWIGLALLLILVALRRVRRDGAMALAGALTAFLVWPSVRSAALDPLDSASASELWRQAAGADWIGLDHGLLSGTFGLASHLGVQLFHAVTPVTGTGQVGARSAGVLVGIAAVGAVYVLGRRAGGPVGAVAAVACVLLTDAFRLSLTSGDSTGTLVLAAAGFAIAVHAALSRPDRTGMAVLGVAGALAVLAEPLWWPGVVAAIVATALRESPAGARRAAVTAALLAFVLVSLPSRASVAHQADGDLNADVIQRATIARNIEFVGRGHGAPPDRTALAEDPTGGESTGLVEYVFGDHSPSVVAGGTLTGAYEGLDAAADRPETKLFGLIAFLVSLAGAAFVLLVPRLRLLILIPALVALVPWFFESRGAPAFAAHVPFWPAMLLGAAAIGHAVHPALRERAIARPQAPSGES